MCLTLGNPTDCSPPGSSIPRQEYWSGLPFSSPGDLPNPGIKPRFPALQADALTSEPPGKQSGVGLKNFHFTPNIQIYLPFLCTFLYVNGRVLIPLPRSMLWIPPLTSCFPGGSEVKASAWNVGDLGSIPGPGRFPWRRKWQPTPVLLPGESHGWRSLVYMQKKK